MLQGRKDINRMVTFGQLQIPRQPDSDINGDNSTEGYGLGSATFQTEGLLRIGNRVWAEDKVPVFLELYLPVDKSYSNRSIASHQVATHDKPG